MKVNEWQWLQDPRESQYRSLTLNVFLKSKSCSTKWKRSATVKYDFKSYPFSAVTHLGPPVLHIPVRAFILTSVLPLPEPSVSPQSLAVQCQHITTGPWHCRWVWLAPWYQWSPTLGTKQPFQKPASHYLDLISHWVHNPSFPLNISIGEDTDKQSRLQFGLQMRRIIQGTTVEFPT